MGATTVANRYQAINDEFRDTIASLPSIVRGEFEKTLQVLLGIKDIRNVQLWTRYGASQRGFISQQISPEQRAMRLRIAELVSGGKLPIKQEIKVKNFPAFQDAKKKAKAFKDYLYGSYTSVYALGITFSSATGSFSYIYAADSDNEDEELSTEERDELKRDLF